MSKDNEYLRKCLVESQDRVVALRKEIENLERAYTWLAFAAVTGWGGVIVLCATRALEG